MEKLNCLKAQLASSLGVDTAAMVTALENAEHVDMGFPYWDMRYKEVRYLPMDLRKYASASLRSWIRGLILAIFYYLLLLGLWHHIKHD